MHWISRPGYLGHLIALIAGAIMPLALAPFAWWPLALVSVGLFYQSLNGLRPKEAAMRGWLYGLGLFAAGTSWVYVSIHDFGAAPPLLAGALTFAFVASLGLFYSLLAFMWARFFAHSKALAPVGFAALWVGFELFRGWVLTGFPWLYVGYSQLAGPLKGFAPIGGVWLLSGLLVASAVTLVQLIAQPRKPLALLILLPLWLLGPWLNEVDWTEPKGAPLSVTAIQGNVAQSLKWDPAKLREQLELYRTLSLNAPKTDLLIWPETAVPVLQEYAQGYLDELGEYVSAHNGAFISGIPVRQANDQGELRYYNGIFSIGHGEGLYLKQKLVPFGEYVPLQDVLRGLIAFFDLPMSDFARGPSQQRLLTAQSYKIAPYICYEVVYPNFAAKLANESDLLLTISNDAWFGRSIGPLQHLEMAQMRALETGRWMIRATNNGVTVLINPKGQITREVPQFTQAVLTGEVTPMQGQTPFMRWQSTPLGLLIVLVLGFIGYQGRRQREGGAR